MMLCWSKLIQDWPPCVRLSRDNSPETKWLLSFQNHGLRNMKYFSKWSSQSKNLSHSFQTSTCSSKIFTFVMLSRCRFKLYEPLKYKTHLPLHSTTSLLTDFKIMPLIWQFQTWLNLIMLCWSKLIQDWPPCVRLSQDNSPKTKWLLSFQNHGLRNMRYFTKWSSQSDRTIFSLLGRKMVKLKQGFWWPHQKRKMW